MVESRHPAVGGKASKIYDIKRDSAGNVVMTTSTNNKHTTPVFNTTTTTTESVGRAYFLSFNYKNNAPIANTIKFVGDGQTLLSSTNASKLQTGSFTTSMDSPINSLRPKANWQKPVKDSYQKTVLINTSTVTNSITISTTLRHNGTSLQVSGRFTTYGGASGTAYLSVNGSSISSATYTNTTTLTKTLTGTFTSPNITWRVHLASGSQVLVRNHTAVLLGTNPIVDSSAIETATAANTRSAVLSGEGDTIFISDKIYTTNASGTAYLSVNGSSIFSTTITATTTLSASTTGTFTSPSITWRVTTTTGTEIGFSSNYATLQITHAQMTYTYTHNQIRVKQQA